MIGPRDAEGSGNPEPPVRSAPFDAVAATYDRRFGPNGNLIMSELRRRSLSALLREFPSGARLLELGCGTGDEALALARAGRHVLATDPSAAMIEQARAKISAERLSGTVTTRQLGIEELCLLEAEPDAANFDGAFASFGPLNCVDDLPAAMRLIARLLKPGGKAVFSIMNRDCLWEIAWFSLHGDLPRARRRQRGEGRATVAPGLETTILVRYYTPGEVIRAARPWLQPTRIEALPLLLPPPYLDHLALRWPELFRQLARLDRRVAGLPVVRGLGDHILMIFQRAPA